MTFAPAGARPTPHIKRRRNSISGKWEVDGAPSPAMLKVATAFQLETKDILRVGLESRAVRSRGRGERCAIDLVTGPAGHRYSTH